MGDPLLVRFEDQDMSDGDIDRLTLSLRQEILQVMEVDRVDPVEHGQAPSDARGVGVVELGSLLVTVKPTVEALVKVVGVLRGWLAIHINAAENRKGSLRITVNGQSLELSPTQDQQQRLVDEFINAATDVPK